MNIAIVGATGNVGRKTLEVLEKKDLSIDNLYLVASSKSVGKKINFKGVDHEIHDLESFDFSKVKICFFAAGGKISEKFAEKVARNCLVIDNSSHFRMDPEVPLIVPQVNSEDLKNMKKNIIANPNCSTAQLVIVLKPLHDLLKKKFDELPRNTRRLFYVSGETDVDTREEIRAITEEQDNAVIVASMGTFSTGINIKRLHNIIFASPSKSQISVLQSIGRGFRKSADGIDTKVYDIADDLHWKAKKNYTLQHAAERIKIYSREKFDYKLHDINI